MTESLTVAPAAGSRQVRAPDGTLLTPPADWALLPPGDAALTRRVKAAGPSWTVVEKKGRKTFSHGVWAPAATIEAVRRALEAERAEPKYSRRLEQAARRRNLAQSAYVEDFGTAVLRFLAFAPGYADLGRQLADAVTSHATPVGSGTVARTKRISVEERAEAAVIAWLRHQTTAYDQMKVPRLRGKRREVRRQLAQVSRALLDLHRVEQVHPLKGCPLCQALASPPPASDAQTRA